MNIFDISHTGGHPLTGDDITFLQNALREGIMSTMQDQVNTPVVLSGCVFTNPTTGLWNWTAGFVYYNGQIYNLASGTATITGLQYLNWAFAQSNLSAGDAVYENGATQHTWIANVASVVVNTTANDMRATVKYPKAISSKVVLSQAIADFNFHTGTNTITSITTPDDGNTRQYIIELQVACGCTSKVSNGQSDFTVEIKQGSSVLATAEFQTWGTANKNNNTSMVLRAIATLPPATVINFNSIDVATNGGVFIATGIATIIEL
jgi:hypothetical protein